MYQITKENYFEKSTSRNLVDKSLICVCISLFGNKSNEKAGEKKKRHMLDHLHILNNIKRLPSHVAGCSNWMNS